MLRLILVTYLAIFLKPSESAITADEIKSMPGYNGTLPSKQYSGMLMVPNTNPQRYYHYWLVTSEQDPANAPVVVMYQNVSLSDNLITQYILISHSFGSMEDQEQVPF